MDRYSLRERNFLVLSMGKKITMQYQYREHSTKSLGMEQRPLQQKLKGNKQVW